jgi:hypothetical protein
MTEQPTVGSLVSVTHPDYAEPLLARVTGVQPDGTLNVICSHADGSSVTLYRTRRRGSRGRKYGWSPVRSGATPSEASSVQRAGQLGAVA